MVQGCPSLQLDTRRTEVEFNCRRRGGGQQSICRSDEGTHKLPVRRGSQLPSRRSGGGRPQSPCRSDGETHKLPVRRGSQPSSRKSGNIPYIRSVAIFSANNSKSLNKTRTLAIRRENKKNNYLLVTGSELKSRRRGKNRGLNSIVGGGGGEGVHSLVEGEDRVTTRWSEERG